MFRKPLFAAAAALAVLSAAPNGAALAQTPAPSAAPLPAPNPAARAEAMRVIQALKLDGVMDQTIAALRPALVQQFMQMGRATPQQAEAAVNEVVLPAIRAASPEIVNGIADIWARRFTAEELRQLGAFYETPVGRKWLEQTPAITAETQAMTMQIIPRVLQDTIARNRDALRQRGIQL